VEPEAQVVGAEVVPAPAGYDLLGRGERPASFLVGEEVPDHPVDLSPAFEVVVEVLLGIPVGRVVGYRCALAVRVAVAGVVVALGLLAGDLQLDGPAFATRPEEQAVGHPPDARPRPQAAPDEALRDPTVAGVVGKMEGQIHNPQVVLVVPLVQPRRREV
jgi:hypothetical protein